MSEVSAATAQYLLRLVANGVMDAHLDALSATVLARRQALSAMKYAAIKIGDRVQTARSLKPRYLAGVTGRVVGKEGKWIRVAVDAEFPTGRYNRTLGFAAHSLDVLPPEEQQQPRLRAV